MSKSRDTGDAAEWGAIGFALVYPSLLTLVYFVWLAGQSSAAQQGAYTVGKAIQFALPAAWVALVSREALRWPRPNGRGMALGVAFGLAAVGLMIAVYFGWFRAAGIFVEAAKAIQGRLVGMGISGGAAYAAMGLFYCVLHSMLEEYYWRWFVFGRLRRRTPLAAAIAVSSIAFAAHHVIVLAWYFGWGSGWTWFFSVSTAVGGAFWAWLYDRTQSIYAPWISHMIIDAGIFAIGYDLLRGVG